MAAPRALSEFVAEATELLELLGRELLALEAAEGAEADPDRLNAIFRGAHSLKGLAAMFGLEDVARLAHQAEDVLDALRLGRVPLDAGLLDALGDAVDVFQRLLAALSQGREDAAARTQAEALGARLQALAGGAAGQEVDVLDEVGIDPQMRAVFTEYEEHRLRENVKKGVGL
jgi:two-component system chemotaxis sensor kinase CheA